MYRWLLLAALLLAPVLTSSATPHRDGQSYVYLVFYQDSVHVRLEITIDDLNRDLGLDMPWQRDNDEAAIRAGIEPNLDTILAYADSVFSIGTPERTLNTEFKGWGLLPTGQRTGYFLLLEYDLETEDEAYQELVAEYIPVFGVDQGHRNFLLIERDWRSSTFDNEGRFSLIFTPDETVQTLDLTESTIWNGFRGMVRFGIDHILDGLDHILFLLALILPAVLYRRDETWVPQERFRSSLWKIVAIATFFTIAHSITLALAALKIVVLPSLLVESIIAGSIAVAALHNLFPKYIKHEATIAFAFGLFHGFGFASLLEPLGLGTEYTALTLLGFNLGVEIGQVFIIALIFPVLYLIRRPSWYRTFFLRYGSVMLIFIAAFWFIERAFDVPLTMHTKDILRPYYHMLIGR